MATDRRGDAARHAAAPDRELLSAADVTRTVARIAHQIIEKTAGESPVVVGIPTRGAVLARRLAAAIGEFSGSVPEVGAVDSCGTSGGGGGGSWHSSRESTHRPRFTVELRVGVAFSVRMLPWVRMPRRLLVGGRGTRTKREGSGSKVPGRP